MSEFTIDDMIGAALEKRPDDFRTAFNDVMHSKLAAAVDQRKQEVAQSYLAQPEEDSEESEEETEEQGEDSTEEDTEESEEE